jgi:nucleoside-diphosphate-sugar epimerase
MRLFVFGLGYTALALAQDFGSNFTRIGGTVRSGAKAETLAHQRIQAHALDQDADGPIRGDIAMADSVLVSVPPDAAGDPVLARFSDAIASAPRLTWIGYLSTTAIYGDHGGAWVDEGTPPIPANERSRRRRLAELEWLELGRRSGKAVHLFRLSGIYGPGRNALVNVADGSARRLVKQGQVFNRIHVDDIAAVLTASMARPRAGAIYNVSDDEPAPPQDVVAFASLLAGVEPPPEVPFGAATLSPLAAGFYAENKRVSNRLIRTELGVRLRYPTYREGLEALRLAGEGARTVP